MIPSPTNTLTCTPTFAYSAETIFSKYSDASALARWWGPHGFTNTFHQFDFQTGGHWIFTMHSPDGQDFANEHIFHLIEENHIITEHIVEPHFQMEIILEELGENERISTFESAEFLEKMRDFLIEKNGENFDRLEEELKNFIH